MSVTDKTIDHSIQGDDIIHLYVPNKPDEDIWVRRKSWRKQERCRHEWLPVSWLFQGHGGWKRGCRNCGKLGR